MPSTDIEVLPLLMQAMAAASEQDRAETTRLLFAALDALPARTTHGARPDITAALRAVTNNDYQQAWLRTHAATCLITTTFPPDLIVCAPSPDARALQTPCPTCTGVVMPGHNFCQFCGTRLTS